MRKLHYLLFILPFLFFTDVFALEVNVTNSITSPSSSTQGRYSGTEIYNTGTTNVYSVNTRYNGRLSRIRYNLPLPDSLGECFTTNLEYTITMNMATDDWRNKFGSVSVSAYGNDYHIGSITYVSYKKIYFKFKIPSSVTNCIDYVLVDLKSTSVSGTAFTGDTNWNLSKITLTDPSISTGGSGGGSSSATPTPTPIVDYSDITNNANQNTENIINNQNQNTQDLIDNSNSNTTDIINNVNDSISQASQVIGNGLSSINSQLGTCLTNLLTFWNVNANINTYLSNGYGYQSDADTYSTPRALKLQLYDLQGNLINQSNDYRPLLEVGRFNFPFTYTNDISYLVFGINGNLIDTTFKLDLQKFDLFPNETYTLSFSVVDATNGDVTFNNFSLIKGNYVSRVVIPYKESVCTSKLDGFIEQSQTNTTDIINNSNQNTQQTINSQKVCTLYDKYNIQTDNKGLGPTGNIIDVNNAGVTDYIKIDKNSEIKVLSSGVWAMYVSFYNINKTFISSIKNTDLIVGEFLTIPQNASYVRFSIQKDVNRPQFEICKNGNQSLSDSMTDLTDTMKDSNIDDKTGFFTNFQDNTHGLTGIITAPLTTIQNLANTSCVPLSIPIPYTNSNVNLPCMTEVYQLYVPSVFTLWQVISFGIISYFICIDIFKMVKGFKDPNEDKIEVLDL